MESNEQIERTTDLLRHTLGPDLLGSYLHGSAVLGGLGPASDLDVLAVTRRGLTESERRTLLAGLLEISGLTRAVRPVELTVVVQSEVRPWRFPPTGDFLCGEWLREAYRAGEVPRPAPMPDLALVLTMTLAGNHPLTGPPPAELLDPVPHADLVQASLAAVPELIRELEEDTRNVLLTLARIWSTLATGVIRPKDEAAGWALEQLAPEHRPVLEHAAYLYRNRHYAEETWSPQLRAGVRPLVAEMFTRIDTLRRRG